MTPTDTPATPWPGSRVNAGLSESAYERRQIEQLATAGQESVVQSDIEVARTLLQALDLPTRWWDESVFARDVIPALEARQLGAKWAEQVLAAEGWQNLQTRFAVDAAWAVAKAPLALRARSALTVLENAKP